METSKSFAWTLMVTVSPVAWNIHRKLETGSDSVTAEEQQQKEMPRIETLQVCCLSKIISSPAHLLRQQLTLHPNCSFPKRTRRETSQSLPIISNHIQSICKPCKADVLRFSVWRSLYASWQQQEGCGQGHPQRIPAWREFERLTRGCLVALQCLKVWLDEVRLSECL